MKNIVIQKLEEIAQCIYKRINKRPESDSLGLYNGEFGILLFLFYYARYSRNSKFISLSDQYTERLLERLGEEINIHTYCGGLSGILYLFEFLRENNFVDIEVENNQIVFDLFLVNKTRNDMQNQHHDFMHGALGPGLYFLKKESQNNIVVDLVNYLYNTAETDNNISKWKSPIDYKSNEKDYNISLSHGVSSIAIFLSRLLKKEKENIKVHNLLEGTINYILSQEIDYYTFGSYFPYQSKKDSIGSRLAWCYGDLTIATTLWNTGKMMNNELWKKKGLDVLIRSTERRLPHQTNVEDAGICHGCAGIAMIYRRMLLETGIEEFRSSVDYWIGQTIRFAFHKDGLAGYKTKGLQIDDYTLLTGISGIGLVFISYLMNDKQEWDEIFLLS